jgi:hypothetical protein
MAGNVKEWCWNSAESDRYILGGAWNEPVYMFADEDARPPFDRSATNGFRCIKLLDGLSDLQTVTGPLPSTHRDYNKEKPASDEAFRIYESFYSYDCTPLNPVVESVDNSAEYWRRERITYAGAGRGRVLQDMLHHDYAKRPVGKWQFLQSTHPGVITSVPAHLDSVLRNVGAAAVQPQLSASLQDVSEGAAHIEESSSLHVLQCRGDLSFRFSDAVSEPSIAF